MILRLFTPSDLPTLAQYQLPGMPDTQILDTIRQWNVKVFQGRYFELLAAEEGGQVIGYVSLWAQTRDTASEGVEIYPPFRKKGHAFSAVSLLLHRAAGLGYSTITARIRQDNAPSLALHRKLGFQITKEDVTSRGHPVYELSKSMEVISNGI